MEWDFVNHTRWLPYYFLWIRYTYYFLWIRYTCIAIIHCISDDKFCSLWQNDSASAIAQRVGEERNLPSDYIAALEERLEYEISLREGFESDPNSWFSVLQSFKACPKQDAARACWSYVCDVDDTPLFTYMDHMNCLHSSMCVKQRV